MPPAWRLLTTKMDDKILIMIFGVGGAILYAVALCLDAIRSRLSDKDEDDEEK